MVNVSGQAELGQGYVAIDPAIQSIDRPVYDYKKKILQQGFWLGDLEAFWSTWTPFLIASVPRCIVTRYGNNNKRIVYPQTKTNTTL